MKKFLAGIAAILSSIVFAQAAAERAEATFNTDLLSSFNSPTQCVEVFLFLSPCIIFVITTVVYYRFITDYTGEIAGLSVVGLLSALYICVRLLVANPHDWATHLKWVFILFYSYVWWDALMVGYFLPRAEDQRLAKADRREIYLLSRNINWPTLGAVFLMWVAARHMVARQASEATVSNYVDGVVSFHLVFASLVCVITMYFGSVPDDPQPVQSSKDLQEYALEEPPVLQKLAQEEPQRPAAETRY